LHCGKDAILIARDQVISHVMCLTVLQSLWKSAINFVASLEQLST
jgi:hypothetical protein